jgi:RNA binding exosome subunit
MRTVLAICIVLVVAIPCGSATFDSILQSVPSQQKSAGPDDSTTVSGLKEALTIGTGNAVTSVSAANGYFGNQLIKILMPKQLQTVADVLSKVGYQKQVDEFILSMNRAAEKAAPAATSLFVDAIKQMTFDDARKILTGGDTAATEYFKSKTSSKLYDAFKPTISTSMNEVGTTRAYKEMIGKYTSSVPFAKTESFDLDHYVTTKSLDGLFYMVGQEEKQIRTNPAARVTDLLKTVFGK